jgi:soluble P-type ATPase
MQGVNCKLQVLDLKYEDFQKEKYIISLGAHQVVAMGNGNNDRMMLKTSRVGIAVCLAEGLASEAARAADIIAGSITDALDLLVHPNRLIATLRF